MGLLYTNYSANPITNNSVSINSVSGTLSKTFKNSYFVRFNQGSTLADRYFGVESFRKVGESYNPKTIPTVVLQTMLCGDKEFLCEIIDKSDYDLMFPENSKLNTKEEVL